MAKNKNKNAELPLGIKTLFDRYEVRIIENIKGGKVVSKTFEKIKLLKAGVKITPEQAHTLNVPIAGGNLNKYAEMYFLPGEDEIFLLPEQEAY